MLKYLSSGGMSRHAGAAMIAAVLALFLLCPMAAFAGEEAGEKAEVYVVNAWNYVDGAMDISAGIPSDALGRLGKIRDAGVLTVATEPYYAPQEYIDPSKTGQDQYAGADMELARLIARRMGVELKIVAMDFNDVLSSVAEGKYDLGISALAFTPDRAASMEMSRGYYFSDQDVIGTLVIRAADAGSIGGIDDLTGRDIAAQSGSIQESMAVNGILHYRQFRRLPTVSNVYEAVSGGLVDAAVVDRDNARVYIDQHPDCALTLLEDVSFSLPQEYAGDRVAAPKGEIQLLYFVNGVIDEVLEADLYNQWFDEHAVLSAGIDN